jgi:hypothetical protein
MRSALLAIIVFHYCFLSEAAWAQARQTRGQPAIVEAGEAGPDYLLQGEYAGWKLVPGRGNEFTGLQVVALGDGKFDAVEYRGGLPGNGWDRSTKAKLSGEVTAGSLLLTGQGEKYLVRDYAAVGSDTTGRELARLVKVGRTSPTLGLAPPAQATTLFDGGSTDHFQPGAKVTPEGLLVAGVMTKAPVGAFHMHIEFRTPFMPASRDQQRGNSGVYIQRRYEVQILDSFGLDGAFNEAGSLYRQMPPDLNMAFPPLTWQTYDIWFSPPRFEADGKTKMANARITLLHNGVPVHWHREITAKTGGGQPEAAAELPIQLQDHGNPVMFRNIWIVPGEGDLDWQVSTTGGCDCIQPCGRIRWLHRRRCG